MMLPAIPESANNGENYVPPPSYNTVEPPVPPPNDLPLAYHYDYYQQYAIPKPVDVHQARPSYPPPRYTPRQTGEFICYMNPVDSEEVNAEARRRQQRYVSRTYLSCLAIFAVVGLVSFGITKAST
jgi:hypothetical protein